MTEIVKKDANFWRFFQPLSRFVEIFFDKIEKARFLRKMRTKRVTRHPSYPFLNFRIGKGLLVWFGCVKKRLFKEKRKRKHGGGCDPKVRWSPLERPSPLTLPKSGMPRRSHVQSREVFFPKYRSVRQTLTTLPE